MGMLVLILVMLGSKSFSNVSSLSQSIFLFEEVVDRGLVALAVAITQPRADSQETRPIATLVVHRRLRGLSIPVLRALLNGMESRYLPMA